VLVVESVVVVLADPWQPAIAVAERGPILPPEARQLHPVRVAAG
jgi:hypothetical protein